MTVKTIVTYNSLPGVDLKDIIVKAVEMEEAGKMDFTDDISIDWPDGATTPTPPVTATRFWVNEDAAQEWIDFLNSQPVPPTETQIVTL